MNRWVKVATFVVIVIFIGGMSVWRPTRFSPEKMLLMKTTWVCVPIVQWPLLEISESPYRTQLMQYFVDHGYAGDEDSVPDRWFYCGCRVTPLHGIWREGNCQGVITSLKERRWLEWSLENPDSAAMLWPVFVKLCRCIDEDAGFRMAALLLQEIDRVNDNDQEFNHIIEKWKKVLADPSNRKLFRELDEFGT